MGAIRKLIVLAKDRKGIALVYIALILVVIIAFVGLAIDIGYMYVTKGQLQNAADAGALAASSKLKYIGPCGANPTDLVQSNARIEAITFADKNRAVGANVAIANDNSNVLSDSNDITVGHWNGTSYSSNTTPVNAIQVRARRTSEAPGGPVSLFFARVLGRETMGAAAVAIATLPIRASNHIALCTDICAGVSYDPTAPTILPAPIPLDRNPNIPGNTQFAWTSLLNQTTSTPEVTSLICTDIPNTQVCGQQIYTTQGTSAEAFKNFEGVFNDPNFDAGNKEFSGSQVTAWWIMSPVVDPCPVTSQGIGNGTEPKLVTKYALIRVISGCDQGGGQPCRPYTNSTCIYDKRLVIDQIACINCSDIYDHPGLKSVLVK